MRNIAIGNGMCLLKAHSLNNEKDNAYDTRYNKVNHKD